MHRSAHLRYIAAAVTDVVRASDYRLIAIDFDGTLLAPNGKVTPRTRDAVLRTVQAGYQVCFATGRNWTESRPIIDSVGHRGPAVLVGGALVVDTRDGVRLQRTLMAADIARAVSEVIEREGHSVLALQDFSTADADYAVSEAIPLDPATALWMELTKAKVVRVADLGRWGHEHTLRVGLVSSAAESRRVRDLLSERFAGQVVCHSLVVTTFDVEVLEVFDRAVNKWLGLLHVADRASVRAEEVIAIGDDVNDVAMLEQAGLGVAMGNAKPEALAVADRVIGSNAEDGLAQFLEALVEDRLAEVGVASRPPTG